MYKNYFIALLIFLTAPASFSAPGETPELPAAEKKADSSGYGDGENLFGLHIGLGFPQVLGVGLNYFSPDRTWGLNLTMGGFNYDKAKSGTDPEIQLRYGNTNLSGRYHPFAGAFYVGAGIGSHRATIEAKETYAGQQVTAVATLTGNFIAPHVGWLWLTDFGLTISTEIGAQIGFSAKTTIDEGTTNAVVLNDANYLKNKKDIEDQGKQIFNSTLPYLTLIRLGYVF